MTPENGNGAASDQGPAAQAARAAKDAATQTAQPTDRPTPEFTVVGVGHVERAAAPTLRFEIEATEATGRSIYTVALTAMIEIEPSKRRYDDAEREKLVELFGEPERWASTTSSLRWAQAQVLVPSFTDSTRFALELPCTYDHEVGATKYLNGPERRHGPPSLPLQRHGDLGGRRRPHAADPGAMGLLRPLSTMPESAWRAMMDETLSVPRLGGPGRRDDRAPRTPQGRARGPHDGRNRRRAARLVAAGLMEKALESLLDSLLYEGYALYPYTPGATKNATPTPFGIVYPPTYAEGNPATFDHLRDGVPGRGGSRGRAEGHHLLPPAPGRAPQGGRPPDRAPRDGPRGADREGAGEEFAFDGRGDDRRPGADASGAAGRRPRACEGSASTTRPGFGCRRGELERGDALRSSLISTHVVAEVTGGRFVSPLDTKGPHADALADCEQRQHVARAGQPGPTRRCWARRSSCPTIRSMAPESLRQPVRLDRDRGGAAAARARAERSPSARRSERRIRRSARWSSVRGDHARSDHEPPRPPRRSSPSPSRATRTRARPASRSAARRSSRAGRCVLRPAHRSRRLRQACWPARWPRSSGSTTTSTTGPTSASRSTTTPRSRSSARRAATCTSPPTRSRQHDA